MNKLYIYIVLLLISLFSTGISFAQSELDDRYNKLYEGLTEEEIEKKKQEEDASTDSIGIKKRKKPAKPFASYLFNDSISKKNKIFAWRYNPYNNGVTRLPVDTMLMGFNNEYFFQRGNDRVSSAYLGNLGSPTVPIAYNERFQDSKLSFLDPYKEYLYTPENVIFYNSKVAFTQFTYITSGQRDRAEEIFDITHAQNISPSTGFNLTYRNNRTRGMYTHQQSVNKNFSFAFNHTGKRYTTHFGYVFNSGEMRENGGVKNVGEIADTLIDLSRNIEVNLNDALTRLKGNGFFYSQTLAIPLSGLKSQDSILFLTDSFPSGLSSLDSIRMVRKRSQDNNELSSRTMLYFGTALEYDSYKKIYSDTKDASNDYYENWYINPNHTTDSIRETSLNMRIFAQLQPYDKEGFLSLITGGVGLENSGFYYFIPSYYLSGGEKIKKQSFYVYGDAKGKWREYIAWNADVKYYPAGYRSQDLEVNGNLILGARIGKKLSTLLAGVKFETKSPSYWMTNYYSNHYRWNNDFDKEVRTTFKGELDIKAVNLKLSFNQTLSTNSIYISDKYLPTQFKGALSVSSLYLFKDFVIGGLHLQHKILGQYSSSQTVAPVPAASINISYFYEFTVVKNALDMQVGFDGRYTTKYYGFGYNPAISQFYNQQTYKVGGYPNFDVFATGKWKRLLFILKLQNANYDLFGGLNNFEISQYPQNRRMFKFGISWSFYN